MQAQKDKVYLYRGTVEGGDAVGFIVKENDEIIKFGDVTVQKVSGVRQIISNVETYGFSSPTYTINNVTLQKGSFQWVQTAPNSGAFFCLKDNKLTVDMASNGNYCFNGLIMFSFSDIKLNESVSMTKQKTEKFQKEARFVYHNGERYPLVSNTSFTLNKGENRDTLETKLAQTEQMYIEFNDKSYMDIRMDKLEIPKRRKIRNQTNSYFSNFKVSNPSLTAETDKTMTFLVTRGDDKTAFITFDFVEVTAFQDAIENITIYSHHKNQKLSVDYNSYREFDGFEEVENTTDCVVPIVKDLTTIKINLKNKKPIQSVVTVKHIEYKENKNPEILFTLDQNFYKYKTENFYMLNDKVYPVTNEFKGFQPVNGDKNFGTYNNGVWDVYPLRLVAKFDENYTIVVFGSKNHITNMSEFGMFDKNDKVKWFVSETKKELTNGRYETRISKEAKPGDIIERVGFQVQLNEKETHSFTCTFVYQAFNKVQYIVEGNEDFQRTERRSSFSYTMEEDTYMCGVFRCLIGNKMSVYGTTVSADSVSDAQYPIVCYNKNGTALIRTNKNSFPLNAEVLQEEKVIKPVNSYTKLNNCADVVFEGSTIKVPMKTGVCLFRADDKIYLFKSGLQRSVSFGSRPGSPSLSRPSSPSRDQDEESTFKAFDESPQPKPVVQPHRVNASTAATAAAGGYSQQTISVTETVKQTISNALNVQRAARNAIVQKPAITVPVKSAPAPAPVKNTVLPQQKTTALKTKSAIYYPKEATRPGRMHATF